MDEAWKDARRAELWESVFKLFRDPGQTAGNTRLEIGIEIIGNYKKLDTLISELRDTREGNQEDDPLLRSVTAYLIWQLISLEIAEWSLLEIADLERLVSSDAPSRSKLNVCLKAQMNAQWPSHCRAIDPMPLFLPRTLIIELLEALDALDRGEVLAILQPEPTGRHDASWNWDVMRTKALQYVEFYRGQGQNKKSAQKLVAIATGVSPNTLRDWEASIKPTEPLEPAFEAGRIKLRQEADPTYGKSGGKPADAHGLHYLHNQLAQPLSEFGRAYQDRFGRRHNQSLSDGD